jgi:hypothetical protein
MRYKEASKPSSSNADVGRPKSLVVLTSCTCLRLVCEGLPWSAHRSPLHPVQDTRVP